MRRPWLIASNLGLLLGCVSIYMGVGWFMWVMSFPSVPLLTPDNMGVVMLPQVAAATRLFTFLVTLMAICESLLIWQLWRTPFRAWAILALILLVAATGVHITFLKPINDELAAHAPTAARLHELIQPWVHYNRIKVILWNLEWLNMAAILVRQSAVYFSVRVP
jgi:uncharacterized membrane protein